MLEAHRFALFGAVTISSVVLFVPAAHAQNITQENRVLADSMFRDGRHLMEEGKIAEGCRKLEESFRLDPAPGTLINLAICHDKEGKIASALSEYRDSLAYARRDKKEDREAICKDRIEALEPQIPKVTVEVPPEARRKGLEVSRNGSTLAEVAWGSAMPSDPGEVIVEAKAPGYKPWRTAGRVDRAGTLRIVVPALAVDETARAAQSEGETGNKTKQIAGLVTGGVGLAAVGLGVAFGIDTLNKKSESDKNCPVQGGAPQCTPQGVTAMDRAHTSATISTVALGAGIVAAGVGTYLFLSGLPHSHKESEGPGALPAAPAEGRRVPSTLRAVAVSVTPLVGPGVGGAVFSGIF